MRFIFYAIFIYLAYIGLRVILKRFANPGSRTATAKDDTAKPRRSKINPDHIEDAEFEEIKKP